VITGSLGKPPGLDSDLTMIGGTALMSTAADQVAKIKRILGELSFDTASPDEARAMLRTKGGENVGF
jgi:uncharacterized protein (DUF849 family)